MFGYIHNFTEICNKVAAMKVVQLISELFSLFDILSENHRVYKVGAKIPAFLFVNTAFTAAYVTILCEKVEKVNEQKRQRFGSCVH